jgi:predicted nicotinamide N-methyase
MPSASGPMRFVRPADPEKILDSLTDEEYEKDKMLPYWAEQWPASFGLYRYLEARCRYILPSAGLVCELGGGIGVISSLIAANGIRCVATDISFNACLFSRYNMHSNATHAPVACFDWRHSCFGRVFDCIVASDIIYEERWIEPVLGFLRDTLVDGGFALIADPRRQWWEPFQHNVPAFGFSCKVSGEEPANDGKTRVEILKLWRRVD